MKRVDPSFGLFLNSFAGAFTFESVFPDDVALKKVKDSIERINNEVNKDYLISNNLGQRIASILKLITPDISHKELSKAVTEVTRIRPASIQELLMQIERLLNQEEPFKTDEHVSIDYLLGRWESTHIIDALDFDINFNMTDFSPSQKVILDIFQAADQHCSIHVSVPVIDWTTHKSVDLKLIDGHGLLDKGMLRISEFDHSKVYKMPILQVDSGQLETYLFKTRIFFEKINAR